MRALCLNAGSSSLKAAVFDIDGAGDEPIAVSSRLIELSHTAGPATPFAVDHAEALADVADGFDHLGLAPFDAIAHRFVHGGPDLVEHAIVDAAVRAELTAAAVFAPLHVADALMVLDAAQARFPGAAHVACLDTAFHRHLLPAARRLPISAELHDAGIRRYGFHGLSYEYLVHRLGAALGGRAVLADLGNGASLAAVRHGVGIDTTMGFTPSGGLVMGTRTGDIDPGVLVYLAGAHALDADGLEQIVDRQSGLLGLSGYSADMRELLEARRAGDDRAALALDVYESVAAKHVAALTTSLGGLDTLVFTGGVGEHAAPVRGGIAGRLAHVGVAIDDVANDADASVVSRPDSRVTVRVEPTDEAWMMAIHAAHLTQGS